jgi:hypothetical protein
MRNYDRHGVAATDSTGWGPGIWWNAEVEWRKQIQAGIWWNMWNYAGFLLVWEWNVPEEVGNPNEG